MNNNIIRVLRIPREIQNSIKKWFSVLPSRKWGAWGINSKANPPMYVANKANLFVGNNVRIMSDATFLNTRGVIKIGDGTGSASHFTVIADTHMPPVGSTYYESASNSDLVAGDVSIEEDVWFGTYVTILPNVVVGRGSVIGAGSVLRAQKIPPYAIVVGNPAKIIGFRLTPEQIIEHESILYEANKRLPKELLENNYKKYYLDRISIIKSFLKQ